jgi:hypothetical protein
MQNIQQYSLWFYFKGKNQMTIKDIASVGQLKVFFFPRLNFIRANISFSFVSYYLI